MKAVVIGLGSIGRRHLGNLRQLVPDAHITLLRHDQNLPTPEDVVKLTDRIVYRLEEALDEGPDCAVIASPAPFHVEVASALAERGVHLFVEKPLSNRLEGVDSLINVCRRQECVLLVGYVLRYHPLLQTAHDAVRRGDIGRVLSLRAEVGHDLREWRPASDYRQTVSARKDLGGGVLLELSHEIDYARWLAGEVASVVAYTTHASDLEIDVEDMAEIVLRFGNGALGNIHLDMVQACPMRTCRVIGTEGILICDFSNSQLRIYSRQTKQWTDLSLKETIARNNMYITQMQHFLDCVAGRAKPQVTGEDGKRALQIVLAAKDSAASGHSIELVP
ncbi:MAG TPA: Gfo/Idh/MocA family oxidoreductase [Thermoguttaceae bacterium]